MSLMELVIRFGTIEDLAMIAEVDSSLKQHQLQWKLQNNEILIAQKGAAIVGYLRLEYLWSQYPYIGLIRVPPEYQRQGIGQKLIAYLEKYLVNQGIDQLYSSSQVNEQEPQAWHRHMGFIECGIINAINDGIGEVFFVKKIRKTN